VAGPRLDRRPEPASGRRSENSASPVREREPRDRADPRRERVRVPLHSGALLALTLLLLLAWVVTLVTLVARRPDAEEAPAPAAAAV
jgi:hypothetical protein